MRVSRRTALLLGSAGTVAVLVPLTLRQLLSEAPALQTPELLPSGPGTLREEELAALFELVSLPTVALGLPRPDRESLDMVIGSRTQQAPSYLAEYRHAIDVFTRLGAGPEAMAAILTPQSRAAVPASARNRVRTRVVAEHLRHALSVHGARSFGLDRVAGVMGGSYQTSTFAPTRRK